MNIQTISRNNIGRMSGRVPFNPAGLSDDQVALMAPSAFAAEAHASRSARYTYIPTSAVIAGMRQEGYVPTFASQSRSRDDSKLAFTKHLVRFRLADSAPTLLGLYPEIILVNSHDGTSAYQLYSGVFRLVCLNGLMTGEAHEACKIHHKGDIVRDVIDASYQVITDSRQALIASDQMSKVTLRDEEKQIFAEAAHQLRFEGSATGEAIPASQLLRVRREADRDPTLFNTLNVVQEAVVRGGQTGYQRDEFGRRTRFVTAKPVGGIEQNTALNRALWTLAERMMQLKAA